MDNFGRDAHKIYYVKLVGEIVFEPGRPDRSGIGSVCLLLGEFSSPNPVYSVLEVCSSVALTVIYSIWSTGEIVNLFFAIFRSFFIFFFGQIMVDS